MKKIYNAPVAVIYNALPVQTIALSTQGDEPAETGYNSAGGGNGNNDSRDNESTNIWDEQW